MKALVIYDVTGRIWSIIYEKKLYHRDYGACGWIFLMELS